MAKRKRLDILTAYRLGKIACELRDILETANLRKIETWDLQQAADMIEQLLEEPGKKEAGNTG